MASKPKNGVPSDIDNSADEIDAPLDKNQSKDEIKLKRGKTELELFIYEGHLGAIIEKLFRRKVIGIFLLIAISAAASVFIPADYPLVKLSTITVILAVAVVMVVQFFFKSNSGD